MTLQRVLDLAMPAITFLLMTVVGMDLTLDHFRKVRETPRALAVGMIAPYLLPLCALLTLKLLSPVPEVAGGLILLASSPGGGISSFYSFVARANVALSVVLTALSCVAAALTMPVLLRVFEFVLSQDAYYRIPLRLLFGQLILLLLAPVLLGFAIRHRWPGFVESRQKPLGVLGFLALGCLISFVLFQTKAMLLANWMAITKAAALFVFLSMVLGYHAGMFFGLNRRDSFTLLIECGARNVAIATTAAVVILHRNEFATLAAVYFLVESGIILSAIALFRKKL